MKQRVRVLGYDLIASSPVEFAKQLRDDMDRWASAVKASGAEQH